MDFFNSRKKIDNYFSEDIIQKYGNPEKVETITSNPELYKSILDKLDKDILKQNNNNYYPKFQYKIPTLYSEKGYKIKLGSVDSYLLLKSSPFESHVKYYTYLSDIPNELYESIIDENSIDNCGSSNFCWYNEKSSVYYIKKHIVLNHNDLVYNYFQKDSWELADKYYQFLKIKDRTYIKYLRKYYFPRLIEENRENSNELVFNNDNIMNRIDNMLKTNIDDYYLNLIKKYDAVISGGNILNTLVSPSQTEINDFDIYVSDKYLKLFIMDVNKHERYNIDKRKDKIQIGYHNNSITNMIEIRDSHKTELQFMFVNEDNQNLFIRKNFDFDSCMNCYNHSLKKLDIYHPNPIQMNKMTISPLYMAKIFDVKDNYSNYRAAKTIERCHKYIKRGFTIENLNEFLIKMEKNI
jgi:hypothetical protein